MVPADAAGAALAQWARLGLRRHPTVGLLPRIWVFARQRPAYDATCVALAEALACPLLTSDARLAAAQGPTCQMVIVRS